MFKYIVVEDEDIFQEQIKKVLRKVSIKEDQALEVEYYKKYTPKLKNTIYNTAFKKVYILDIKLPGRLSGLEIAKLIREVDWESEIIFVTNHDKMFETVHRSVFEVFDFIEKFIDMENRLEEDIKLIYQRKFDKKMLYLNNRNLILKIYLKSITHIVRDKEERKSIIYTNSADEVTFKVSYNLKELLQKLDDRFIQVHRSCIVNKDHIVEYNYSKGYFITDNGKKVDYLSKKYRQEIKQ